LSVDFIIAVVSKKNSYNISFSLEKSTRAKIRQKLCYYVKHVEHNFSK